ncbi:MAG: hypothetical protein ACXACX_09280 [Candidatus Hodarchaeales archaeon]|jgi:hypothetical protein
MANKVFLPYEVTNPNGWYGPGIPPEATSEKVVAVNPGDPPVGDHSNFLESGFSGLTQYFYYDKSFSEKMSSVDSITIKAFLAAIVPGPEVKLIITDSLGTWKSSAIPLTYGGGINLFEVSRTTMSDNSTPWSESELRHEDIKFGIEAQNYWWTRLFDLWLEGEYAPGLIQVDPVPRMIISQMIHEFALRHHLTEIKLPPWVLDLRITDHLFLVHPEGPYPDGNGWKFEEWERRLLRNFGTLEDPDGSPNQIKTYAFDLRKYLTYFRDTMVSPYSLLSDENLADGPLRLDSGVTRFFIRNTNATIEDVDGVVVQLSSNTERIGPRGMLIEDYRKNFVKESSFKNWSGTPTGWTEVDPGAALTVTSGDTSIFDPDLGTHSLILTYVGSGTEQGVDSVAGFTWEQDDNGCLSIDHQDDTLQPIKVGLKRSSDSYWRNFQTSGWQASSYYHELPIASGEMVRDYLGFYVGSTNYTGTFTVSIRVNYPNQKATLEHIQLEGGTITSGECAFWGPTSRIITESVEAVERDAEDLYIETNPTEGRRIINPNQGSMFAKIDIDYSHDDLANPTLPSGSHNVAIMQMDMFTEDDFLLYYNTSGENFIFSFRGINSAIDYKLQPGEYVFGLRWTSDKGEQNLGYWYIDSFASLPSGQVSQPPVQGSGGGIGVGSVGVWGMEDGIANAEATPATLGFTDSDKATMSFWMKADDEDTLCTLMSTRNQRVKIYLNESDDPNKIYFLFLNVSAAVKVRWIIEGKIDDTWHHYVLSYDLAIPEAKLYLDGELQTIDLLNGSGDVDIKWDDVEFAIGGNTLGSWIPDGVQMAQTYINIGEYVNLGEPDNLACFYAVGHKAVSMGSDGSVSCMATLPELFENRDGQLEINDGTGGNLTEAGTLTTPATRPEMSAGAPPNPITEDDDDKKGWFGRFTNMNGVNRLNGFLSRIFVSPFVLTDEEMKAKISRMYNE